MIRDAKEVMPKEILEVRAPKLMKSNDDEIIVLMNTITNSSGMGTGMVVQSDVPRYPIGYYSQRWDVNDFEDYNEEVSIVNVKESKYE